MLLRDMMLSSLMLLTLVLSSHSRLSLLVLVICSTINYDDNDEKCAL